MASVNKQVKDRAGKAKDAAGDAAGQAGDAAGAVKGEVLGSFTDAARDILGPAVQQLSLRAAEQAATYAKEQGPKIVQEQVLPKVMESAGVDNPADLAKAGVGKAGQLLSGAGGITGVAGKIMSKLGGGKGGGSATGYGQKRRMPVQQDMFVSVSVEDAFKGWTEFKRWTEFMHRANLVDPQPSDDGFRLQVTEKMWGFKRPFTAEIVSQVPNEHIRWSSTQGTKHVGVIAFHPLGDRLTLISVNLDHAPSGLIEKTARGQRFVKRAIRADLHRFKGWIEHKSPQELEEMEGWLGTIEDGQIVQQPEDYEPSENGGQPRAEERESDEAHAEPEAREEEPDEPDEREEADEDEQPEDREEEPDGDEGDDEDEAEDEEDGYEELRLAELRAELRDRGLPSRGPRRVLIDRLHDDDESEDDEDGDEEKPEPPRRRARTARR